MAGHGLAAAAVALGIASVVGLYGPDRAPAALASARGAALGPGAPDALLAAPLPPLRLAVPAGGHASLRVGLEATRAGTDAAVDVALVRLLGVPGEWALEGLARGDLAPNLETSGEPVPEPGSLGLVLFGAAGLAGARTAAGRGRARTSP